MNVNIKFRESKCQAGKRHVQVSTQRASASQASIITGVNSVKLPLTTLALTAEHPQRWRLYCVVVHDGGIHSGFYALGVGARDTGAYDVCVYNLRANGETPLHDICNLIIA